MPSGNGNRAMQKRERNAKQAAAHSGGVSQIKVNAAAMNIVCSVCRQPFMSTTRKTELEQHVSSKHDKKTLADCFPNYSG